MYLCGVKIVIKISIIEDIKTYQLTDRYTVQEVKNATLVNSDLDYNLDHADHALENTFSLIT